MVAMPSGVAGPAHASEPDLAVTVEERHAGRLATDRLRAVILRLHALGHVVLRNALPTALVDSAREALGRILRDCMESRQGDAWYQVSRREQAVFWERGARWRIFPKLRSPFSDVRLLANPLVLESLVALLDDPVCRFVSSDTCLRGSTRQAPHRELGAAGAASPAAYFLNVPLTSCRPDSGPLEIWSGGTHFWRAELLARQGLSDDVQDGENAAMEAFAAGLPSRRVLLEPGDILIRDAGALHRGTPNLTDEPRMMLTICYTRPRHVHDYGTPRYNLDEALLARLPPPVRRLFPDGTAWLVDPAPEGGSPAPTAGGPEGRGRARRLPRWLTTIVPSRGSTPRPPDSPARDSAG